MCKYCDKSLDNDPLLNIKLELDLGLKGYKPGFYYKVDYTYFGENEGEEELFVVTTENRENTNHGMYFDSDGYKDTKFKYCPMCGRKLNR